MISVGETEDFTRITFQPDLAKFGLTELTDDVVQLFLRRTVDVAGTVPGVAAYFDGQRIEVDGFRDYVSLFTDDFLYLNLSPRWKVGRPVLSPN